MKMDETERRIPDQPWPRVGLFVLIAVVIATAGWEMYWRSNYFNSGEYVNSNGLWAIQRRAASEQAHPTVIIGSSRIFFDVNLDVWERVTGDRPIQLALEGTGPRPFLHDLAEDATFEGVVIVGYTPPLVFLDAFDLRLDAIDYYKTESPSEFIGQRLSMMLEARLAFLDGSTPLFNILKNIPLESRDGVNPPHMSPRKLMTTGADRSTKMWSRVEQDTTYRKLARDIWVFLIEGLPKPPPDAPPFDPTPVFESVKIDVDKIRARGGDVVFVRPPSMAIWRDLENGGFPRERFWDPLLEYTNTGGVHFEDNSALQGLELPEWSHLAASEAEKYTEALAPLVLKALETREGVKDPSPGGSAK